MFCSPELGGSRACVGDHLVISSWGLQVYIQHMKFSQRVKGIKAARAVFKRAREDVRSKHHVRVSCACVMALNYCKFVVYKVVHVSIWEGRQSGWVNEGIL